MGNDEILVCLKSELGKVKDLVHGVDSRLAGVETLLCARCEEREKRIAVLEALHQGDVAPRLNSLEKSWSKVLGVAGVLFFLSPVIFYFANNFLEKFLG